MRTRDGVLHELDVLVLATGFKADAFMRPMRDRRPGRPRPSSRSGRQRPNAYLSISIPEFPNFFMVNGPNGPVGNFSLIEVAEIQFGYIMQLDRAHPHRASAGRSARAARRWTSSKRARAAAAQNTVWVTGCRSWYLDDRGIPATWPWSFDRFRSEMREPQLANFDLR